MVNSMQRPVQITSRDFQLTPAMEAQIRERAADLQLYFPRLTGCHVTGAEAPVHHHRKGGPFNIGIDLRAPRRGHKRSTTSPLTT